MDIFGISDCGMGYFFVVRMKVVLLIFVAEMVGELLLWLAIAYVEFDLCLLVFLLVASINLI